MDTSGPHSLGGLHGSPKKAKQLTGGFILFFKVKGLLLYVHLSVYSCE